MSQITKLYRGVRYVIKSVRRDVVGTGRNMMHNAKKGWIEGGKAAAETNKGCVDTFISQVNGARKNTKIRKDDLPAIGGLIGMCSVIPGGTSLGYCLGKLLQRILKAR